MASDIKYFIGIDGGGTKCHAAIFDDNNIILGEGIGGEANVRLGLDLVVKSINSAIDIAFENAGLNKQIAKSCALGIGLAGLANQNDADAIIKIFSDFGFVNVASDAHIACLGAYDGKDGAILISGTGSIGYAIVGGKSHKIGGWGFEISDDGSGAIIGREALHETLLCYDGIRPHTALSKEILAKFDGNPRNIVKFVTGAKPKDFGTFAPLVTQFAQDGDIIATEIMQKAAHTIGLYILRLNEIGAPKICMLGGMAAALRPWLPDDVRQYIADPINDAIGGALLLARGANNGFAL